jgi:hypothetical protein
VKHPPANVDNNQSFFPLGCGLCRSQKLDEMKSKQKIVQVMTEEAFVPKIWRREDAPVPEPL